MHRMGAADALGPRLAQPQKTRLALLDQPAHRADRVLDGHRRIDPVLEIDIDGIDAEPLQARLARLLDIFGAAVDAAGAAILAEFGGEHDLVAPALQRAPEQLLILPKPI